MTVFMSVVFTQGGEAGLVIIIINRHVIIKKHMTGSQKSQIAGKMMKAFNRLIIDEDISQVVFTNKHNSKRHMSEK